MTNRRDVERAWAAAELLGDHALEELAGLKRFAFPLRGRAGLFEVRCNGVRIYGGRIGKTPADSSGELTILVLLDAEEKGGRSSADDRLLETCEAELKRLQHALSATT